jgi:hypothetical protein
MSYSSDKKHKLIFENWRRFVSEKADPSAVDKSKFPTKLSQVDAKTAQSLTRTGVMDGDTEDDKIPVKANVSYPVSKLKPSQSSMNIDKALGMALAMITGGMPTGGNLGAFISNDLHIMDGHHRWVATAMVDPTKEVGGYFVDFPGIDLIAILNAITVGRLGINTGKSGTGGFDQFQEPSIRAKVQELLKTGNKYFTPEKVLAALEKFSGAKGKQAIEVAIQKFVKNLKSVKFVVPAGAPARPDMPVIDPDKVANATTIAAQALDKGEVDVNPPYGKMEKK